jgi:hypothetical protein
MSITNGDRPHKHAKRIIERLNERGVGRQCPMCKAQRFKIIPSFFAPFLSDDADEAFDFEREKRLYPCIGLVCENCGFTTQHSLEPLGLKNLFDN